MKRVLRYLGRLIYSLLALLLLAVTAVTILLTTEGGTRLAFYTASQLAPGELQYERVQGTLLRDLTITGLSYQLDELDVAVTDLHLRWRPWTTLNRQLHVRDFSASGVKVRLPDAAEPPDTDEPFTEVELPDIEWPLAIQLDRVQIRDVAVTQGDRTQHVERFHLRAHTDEERLQVASLVLVTPEAHLQLHGELTPQGAYPLNLQTMVRADIPDHGVATAEGSMSGDLDELQIQQTVVGPLWVNVSATLSEPLTPDLQWQAEARVQQADAYPLVPDLARLRLDFSGEGSLSSLTGDLQAEGRHSEWGDFQAGLQASYKDTLLTLSTLNFALPEQDLSGQLSGTSDLDLSDLSFEADFAAELSYGEHPKLEFDLSAIGDQEHAEQFAVQARAAGSEVTLSGGVRWLPEPSWDVALAAQGRDLEQWHPEASGTLDVILTSIGEWGSEPNVQVSLAELSGELLGFPVAGQGELAYASEQLQIDALELRSDDSYLAASGAISENLLDLELALQTGDLSARLLDLHGELTATAQLSGTPTAPQGSIQAHSDELRWQEWALANLDLALELDGSLTDLPTGQFSLETLSFPAAFNQAPIEAILVELSQDNDQHWTRLSLQQDGIQLATMAQGTWQDNHWSGQLAQFSLVHPIAGAWQLSQPAAIQAGQAGADIPGLCLLLTSDIPAELCLDASWDAASNDFAAALAGTDLDYNLFADWFPEQLETSGQFSLFARASQTDNHLEYQAGIDVTDSLITLPEQDIELTLAASELLRVSGDLDELTAQLELISADLEGGLKAQAEVKDLTTEPTVAGDLTMDFTNLSFISLLTPELQEISGHFGGELQFNGALTEPVITGGLALSNGAADVPAAGIRLRNIGASITAPNAPGEPFMMAAQADSDQGQIRIGGSYLLSTHEARFQVSGNDFLAMDTRDIELRISPDMQLTFLPGSLRIRGGVTVPQALIRPPDIETTDSSSRDTIIVYGGDEVFDLDGTPQLPVDMDIQVTLGDDVRVSAFGFEGQLQGRLRVIEQPGQETSGVGTINVASGQYELYGQELDIERGNLSFTGGPIVNPGLDLRVSRRFDTDNVTVGARVGGSLREPTLNLFSTPNLQDSTILSYLILGRAPGRGNQGEQNMLAQASMALGMRGGNVLGEQLSDALGVDEVSVDATGDSFDSASLYIGKHLSSRLYVKYGIGLVEPVSTFFIQYRLTDHLNFETQTGSEHSGADLFYTIER